jgi:hypothetical protein
LGFISAGDGYTAGKASAAAPAPEPAKEAEPAAAAAPQPAAGKKAEPKKQKTYPRLRKSESSSFVPSGFSDKSLGQTLRPD